jgi:ribose 5-phosphate isomerase B
MKIFIGSDHRGYELKEKLKVFFKEEKINFEDLGNLKYDPQDDYPDYTLRVAEKVVKEGGKGILLCGSGQGICIAANKVRGIRAGVLYNTELTKQATEDDDINVLCLAANYMNEELAKSIIKTFLNTEFSGEKRHIRRLDKIKEIENK